MGGEATRKGIRRWRPASPARATPQTRPALRAAGTDWPPCEPLRESCCMSCTNRESMPPLTVIHGGSSEKAVLRQRSDSQPMSRETARRQPEIEPAVNAPKCARKRPSTRNGSLELSWSNSSCVSPTIEGCMKSGHTASSCAPAMYRSLSSMDCDEVSWPRSYSWPSAPDRRSGWPLIVLAGATKAHTLSSRGTDLGGSGTWMRHRAAATPAL
eukprot:scaffold112543_cov36-Phaeocystis_antarctica.AAC.1